MDSIEPDTINPESKSPECPESMSRNSSKRMFDWTELSKVIECFRMVGKRWSELANDQLNRESDKCRDLDRVGDGGGVNIEDIPLEWIGSNGGKPDTRRVLPFCFDMHDSDSHRALTILYR